MGGQRKRSHLAVGIVDTPTRETTMTVAENRDERSELGAQTHRQADRQTDRRTDTQTDTQTDRQTDRQTMYQCQV